MKKINYEKYDELIKKINLALANYRKYKSESYSRNS